MVPEQPTFKAKIPPAITKYLRPDTPREARLLAARGLIPMAPSVLVSVLTYFLEDADEDVRQEASKGLREMPASTLQGIVKNPCHPRTLDFVGRERHQEEALAEAVLLNALTPDATIANLAPLVSESLATIIANNQVRLLRLPLIAENLKKNPQALQSTLDTMISFLRINGVMLEGESPELTPEEVKAVLAQPLEEETGQAPKSDLEILEEEIPDEEVTPEKKKNITQRLAEMNVSGKVKMALKGNKEVRGLLIKESNKIVATAVVKNPGISDGEVVAIANSRTVHDDVIRIVSRTPDWTKHYTIQVALANNPKTPFPVALKFMRMLRVGDLKKLCGNKNVPSQLSKLAKELFERKRK